MKKGIFGILLLMEGNFLLLTFLLSLYYNEGDSKAFLLTTVLCYIVGLTCKWLGERNKENQRMSRADSFLIVSLSWVVFSLIGMIPFIMIERMDVASAFFETMSGFTTTGATCISDIDSMTHALKFWRSVTQWMGGLGIVVFSIALIPVYEMKNTNVFSAEVTGIGLNKLRPKIGSTARRLLIIYLVLTFACSFFYWIGPMNIYDAVCHSMTTIATGGFSTHTASIGYFHSRYLEYVAPFFMLMRTSRHSQRVAQYSREIAKRYGYTVQQQNEIYMTGLLHDIGKNGIPDTILNKPGKLTEEEFNQIRSHPLIGARILRRIQEMPKLVEGARWHHERYDGTGYPDRLSGKSIPEEARIIAVADAYDAMSSKRSYRDVLPDEIIRQELIRGKGTQFDPVFADIMLEIMNEESGTEPAENAENE